MTATQLFFLMAVAANLFKGIHTKSLQIIRNT